MPEIGNLLVSLQMETASFNKGLADANKRLDGFANQFGAIGKNIQSAVAGIGAAFAALGLSAAISGIAGWAKGMADAGESTANLAFAMGLTIDQTIALQGIFQLTTGTLAEASGAMRIFIGHIVDATAKAGPSRESFAQLGISLAELQEKGRDPQEMLKLFADRMLRFQDDAVKAAVGTALFGRAWEKIAPVVSKGREEIERLEKQAAALDPAARAAAIAGEELDKELDTLNKSVQGLSNQGFEVLSPLLIEGAQNLSAVAQMARRAIAAFDDLLRPLGGVVGLLRELSNFGLLGMVKGAMTGNWRQMLAGATGGVSRLVPGLQPESDATLEDVNINAGGGGDKMRVPSAGGGGKKGGGDAEARRLAREAEKERMRLQREAIEAAEEENKISDELFRRKEQRIKSDVALDNLTKQEGIDAERKLLDDKMVATQGFYQRKLAAAVADADETRKLQNQEKLDYEKFLTEREGLNQESAKKLHDDMKEAFSDLGSALKSSFEGIFDSLLEGTFKLRDAVGKLLKDIGKKLISKGFDKLFDIGGSAFGKLFTAGLPGAQYGANFKVGGAGALDSQLVAFRASPGEMVSVNRPGDYGGRGGGQTVRIDLNPSEGWVAGVADQRIVTRSGQIIDVAVRQSQKTVARNFAGMTAETQARQM